MRNILKEWKVIRLRIASLLPVRNMIPHHPVMRTGTSDGRKPIYIYSIHIEPYEAILAKEHEALEGKKEIDIDDLEEHSKSVEQRC